jgi:hypothetical protein
MTLTTFILFLLVIPVAFFCGLMWERMQWETLVDEELFDIDYDKDLGI